MKKRSYTAQSPKKRLAHQDQMAAEMQSSSPIHQNIQDKKDKERSAEWRKTFRQAIAGQDKSKPKRKPRQSTPKKESEKKQSKGQGRSYPSYASSSQSARSSNRRTNRTYSGRGTSSAGADPYGTQARAVGRESTQAKRAKERRRARRAEASATGRKKPLVRVKSIDEINGILKGMLFATKDYQEQATQARMTGVNADTKMKIPKGEGSKGKAPKEVKTGNRFNLQNRVGDPALRKNFNSLLDAYQARYKSIFDEQAANDGKPAKVTGTATRGAKGTDHRVKPKPIGSTTADQKVMQS